MSSLLVEIWLWLVVAALSGLAAGWLLWGRGAERTAAIYRGRIARLRRNWEMVEEQLSTALARISELEDSSSGRTVADPSGSAIPSNDTDVGDPWSNERDMLEATVAGLDQRIQTLETRPLLQNAVVDAPPIDRSRI